MTTATAPDLTKSAPRSPFEKLEGVMLAPRALDKARAHLAGTLGEYIFCDCPVNQMLFDAIGTTQDDFLEAVRTSSTDEDVARWLHERVRPDPSHVADLNERVLQDPKMRELDREEGRA